MRAVNRSLWCCRCTNSWTMTYSTHRGGFLASSEFSQMRRASMLQAPHLVRMRLTRDSSAMTPMIRCHVASIVGTSAFE